VEVHETAVGRPAVEAALRSEDAVVVADDRGHLVAVNGAAAELLGYSPAELFQHSIFDLTPCEYELDGLVLWKDFIELGFQAGVYWFVRKDASTVEVAYRGVANVQPGDITWFDLCDRSR
jgi:PAS domain S-box-containing protein